MIRILVSQGGLEFIFTKSGLTTFMSALETLLEQGKASVTGVGFTYANENRMLELMMDIKENNCYKIRKHDLLLSLEQEDIEDALERFRAEKDGTDLYPEWVQATNSANKKSGYIYVSLEKNIL